MSHLPKLFDKDELTSLLLSVLALAEDGLKKRGFNEEIFLAPLYERAEKQTNPAKEMREGLRSGTPILDYVYEYGSY